MLNKKKLAIGNLFMIVAPSGAGKSTLINALLKYESNIVLSISYTTRLPRYGEKHGREYYFTTTEDFLRRENNGEFLESARVHGNYYGTSQLMLLKQIRKGVDVFLEIDWQGAQQIKKRFSTAIGIFILPPSISVLKKRLKKRALDVPSVINQRVMTSTQEMIHSSEFEYVIINQKFKVALSQLIAIIHAARCQFSQQIIRHACLFKQLGIQNNISKI